MPLAAVFVESNVEMSVLALEMIVPPAFGSLSGSGKLYGNGRVGSWISSPIERAVVLPESSPAAAAVVVVVVVVVVLVDPLLEVVPPSSSSSSSPPQPTSAAAARPAMPIALPLSNVRRLDSVPNTCDQSRSVSL